MEFQKEFIEKITENRARIEALQAQVLDFKNNEKEFGKEFNRRLEIMEKQSFNTKIKVYAIFTTLSLIFGSCAALIIKYLF